MHDIRRELDLQWERVLFYGEFRFRFHGNARRKVYRRPEERFTPSCFEERVSFSKKSCMVWGCLSMEGKTDTMGVNTLIAIRYIEKIFVDNVVFHAGSIGVNFIFIYDNERPHTGCGVTEHLEHVEIPVIEWLPPSLAATPNEYLWVELFG